MNANINIHHQLLFKTVKQTFKRCYLCYQKFKDKTTVTYHKSTIELKVKAHIVNALSLGRHVHFMYAP